MIRSIRLCCCIGLLLFLLGHLSFPSSPAIQLTHGPSWELVLTNGPGKDWFTFVRFLPASDDTSEQETVQFWIGSWSEPFKARRILIPVDPWDQENDFTWSSDGQWIVYASAGQLYKHNRNSGKTVQLTFFSSEGNFVRGLKWFQDGNIRAVRDCTLISVSEKGAGIEELMRFDGPSFSDWTCPGDDDSLSHSPDGRFLVWEMNNSSSVRGTDLVLVDIKTGEVRKLYLRNRDTNPTWIDSQTLLFSRLYEDGKEAVLELDVLTGSLCKLASGFSSEGSVLLHPNGEWILVARSSLNQPRKPSKHLTWAKKWRDLGRFLTSLRLWKIRVKRCRIGKTVCTAAVFTSPSLCQGGPQLGAL